MPLPRAGVHSSLGGKQGKAASLQYITWTGGPQEIHISWEEEHRAHAWVSSTLLMAEDNGLHGGRALVSSPARM